MDFSESEEHQLIRRQIRELMEEYDDDYWREKDQAHEYPHEFFETFADTDWCGLTIPAEYGGQGYGMQEAAIVQQELARGGAAQTATSITAHHVYASAPLVAFGDEAHKQRYLQDVANGDVHMAVSVTEPNAGLDTSRIETTAERDGDRYVVNGQKLWTTKAQEADVIMLLVRTTPRADADRLEGLTLFFTEFDADWDTVQVAEIDKAGRHASDSNEVWFEDFRIPAEDRIGEAGEGFKYLLEFANTERISLAAGSVGIGQAAIEKAADYATERVVFDDPIGAYQAIQHPLADSWSKLELAETQVRKAAWLYDNDEDCGAEANAVKLRASEAAVEACERAMRVHGGVGYAEEYDVARYLRESYVPLLAPVSNEMVNNYIAQHVLGLPRSY